MLSIVSDAPTPHSPPWANAVERAQDQEHRQARREAGCEFEHRIQDDIHHQGGTTAEAVRGPAEQEGPYGAHRQGQQDGEGNVRDVGVKFRGNVLEHEHQQKEIKRRRASIPEARGHECLWALVQPESAEMTDEAG